MLSMTKHYYMFRPSGGHHQVYTSFWRESLLFYVKKKTQTCSIYDGKMLDVITSFNFNCYSPMMDWRNKINDILSNDTPPRSFNPERPYCFVAIATDHVTSYYRYISKWLYARPFEVTSPSDVNFSQPYTPCSIETKDVITSKIVVQNW
jgi:hypothetical protein